MVFTQEVPDEDILKESGWFETVLENLLQSPDEAVLPTEEKRQTASLWKVKQRNAGSQNGFFSCDTYKFKWNNFESKHFNKTTSQQTNLTCQYDARKDD